MLLLFIKLARSLKPRKFTECSSPSSDSPCLEGSEYTTVGIPSDETLLQAKTKAPTSEGRKSSVSCLEVISLAVSVVCFLALLAGEVLCYVYVYNSSTDHAQSFSDEQVCMPCDQLSPDPLAESESPFLRQLESHFDKEKETKMCCARTPAQYAALFKLILKRQEEVKKYADIFGSGGKEDDDTDGNSSSDSRGTNLAVSAHLPTKPASPEFIEKHGLVMQQWKSPNESTVSHVRKGLRLYDNKVYVQTPGLYFVYCQIMYKRAHSDTLHHPKLVSNYVMRHSILFPSTSDILLKARHTRASGEDDRHSSYVGGLVFLHRGDQLFVRVSVPELVSHDDKASFFGLFKVGN